MYLISTSTTSRKTARLSKRQLKFMSNPKRKATSSATVGLPMYTVLSPKAQSLVFETIEKWLHIHLVEMRREYTPMPHTLGDRKTLTSVAQPFNTGGDIRVQVFDNKPDVTLNTRFRPFQKESKE